MRSRRALPGPPDPSVRPPVGPSLPHAVPPPLPLAVPLLLAVLALTAGCVTVRPPEPAGAPRIAEAARTAPAPARRAEVRELPLGPLPEAPPAPADPGPGGAGA
ncbi:hypothetical protein ACEPPI_32835, partial [Streptomyces sp. AB3(2024)]